MKLLLAALAALLPIFISCEPIAKEDIVERASLPHAVIKQGTVIGTTTRLGNGAQATKFAGVPFAKSPPIRFAPPEKAPSFTAPYKAFNTKPACIQQFLYPKSERDRSMHVFNNPGGAPPKESEDCMYLNVFVPPNTKRGDKKPVMYWIFGGALMFGTGSLDAYDGSSFAVNQDVIVVTPNYRTNVFGFANSPEIPAAEQNMGYLDQRFALEWVQQNIAAFGGDPSKVTLFGESAGGTSIKQLLALPPSPIPFRAAILESEASLSEVDPSAWSRLTAMMGCASAKSPLKCMRKKDAKKIKETIEKNSLIFWPETNGITAVSDIGPYIRNGSFAHVPFFLGTNADEGRVFAYVFGLENPAANATKALGKALGNNTLAEAALKLLNLGGSTPYLAFSEAFTLVIFQCQAEGIASTAAANGYNVWRYFYNASYPDEATFPDPGAYHSSEIPQVYGTYPRAGSALGGPTASQKKLSAYMQTAWANFAKDPTTGPGWSQYGAMGNVQRLGYPNKNGGSLGSSAELDQNCVILEPLLAGASL